MPLMVIYTVVVLVFASDELRPDETRYLDYATNLTHGYYTDVENPAIWNGPGYPLAISLFVLCKAPYIIIQLLNVLFLTIAAWFLFKSLSIYINPKKAMVFSYLFGLYPPMIRFMVYIYTEPFAIFLACGFMYYALKLNNITSKKYRKIVISACFLGFLALTRVEFGYVVMCALLFYLVLYLFRRSKRIFHTLLVLVGGFIVCIPFLYYTYTITGQFFSWGTQGGAVLYWHSTPFPDEYGDWISSSVVLGIDKDHPYSDISELSKNHRSFIKKVESPSHSEAQKDKMYREKAIENMKEYPLKYLKNTGASALRLFFEYPLSYKKQTMTTYFYLLPNIFLVVFLILSFYLTFRKASAIPFEVYFIALISVIYIGGMILANGRVRHLLPIVPLLVFYIAFTLIRFTRFEIIQNLDKAEFKTIESNLKE